VDNGVKALGGRTGKHSQGQANSAESSKEGCGSERVVFPMRMKMMMVMMIMVAKPLRLVKLHLHQMDDGSLIYINQGHR
jgi:hypothetical protein